MNIFKVGMIILVDIRYLWFKWVYLMFYTKEEKWFLRSFVDSLFGLKGNVFSKRWVILVRLWIGDMKICMGSMG